MLTARDEAVVSPQVINEYVSVSQRLFRAVPVGDVHARARDLLPLCRAPLVPDTTLLAMTVQTRYAISWWDALIVASALQAGCRYLLSEDMQPGMSFGDLTVINPFVTAPDALSNPN